MLLLIAWTVSLVLWVVLWALGAKALDGMLLVILIMVSAVVAHIAIPMLPGNRRARRDQPGAD
jgi:hypothetical protein